MRTYVKYIPTSDRQEKVCATILDDESEVEFKVKPYEDYMVYTGSESGGRSWTSTPVKTHGEGVIKIELPGSGKKPRVTTS